MWTMFALFYIIRNKGKTYHFQTNVCVCVRVLESVLSTRCIYLNMILGMESSESYDRTPTSPYSNRFTYTFQWNPLFFGYVAMQTKTQTHSLYSLTHPQLSLTHTFSQKFRTGRRKYWAAACRLFVLSLFVSVNSSSPYSICFCCSLSPSICFSHARFMHKPVHTRARELARLRWWNAICLAMDCECEFVSVCVSLCTAAKSSNRIAYIINAVYIPWLTFEIELIARYRVSDAGGTVLWLAFYEAP